MKLTKIKEIIDEMVGFDIGTKRRQRHIVYARFLYCKIAKAENPLLTTSVIGKAVNRDHATVLHALKNVDIVLSQDKDILNLYYRIVEVINRHKIDNRVQHTNLQDAIKEVNDISEAYEAKIEFLKAEAKKRIDALEVRNKKLQPILELLELVPEEHFEEFKNTRLKPFIQMKKAIKKIPLKRVSKYFND